MADASTDTHLPFYRAAVQAPLPTSAHGQAANDGLRSCSQLFTRPIEVIEIIEV